MNTSFFLVKCKDTVKRRIEERRIASFFFLTFFPENSTEMQRTQAAEKYTNSLLQHRQQNFLKVRVRPSHGFLLLSLAP